MSQEEREWLEWSKRAREGKMTQREAAVRMGVSEYWVRCAGGARLATPAQRVIWYE